MSPIYKSQFLLMMAITAMVSLFSCQSKKQETSKTADGNVHRKVQTVGVVNPSHQDFTADVTIAGTALPYQQVMLHAMESGYVKSVKKDIGDGVAQGETVAVLANPELYRQKQKLEAQLQAKKSIYDRLKSIQSKTPALTTLQLVEDARADYETAKAGLDAIEDRIAFLAVKAPFKGTITKRLVDKGAVVQSGLDNPGASAIYEIQQTDLVRLTVPLPEVDAVAVRNGMDVTVSFPSLPGHAFHGKISRTARSLDPASNTMQTEIDIPNADGVIKPGMYANVTIQISSRENTLSLPITAQFMEGDAPFLLVVNNNRVERVPLKKGLSNKDYFEVLNEGITPGSEVIVEGKSLVQPGEIVEPVLKNK